MFDSTLHCSTLSCPDADSPLLLRSSRQFMNENKENTKTKDELQKSTIYLQVE